METSPPTEKILHLITLSVMGGAQDNTFSTVELHDRQRYEVHLACNPDGQWIDRARQAADQFHAIPTLVTSIAPRKDLRALIDIVKLLRRERFSLIHTHTAKAGFLGRIAAALCKVPVVVHTYHAFPFHDFMPVWKRWVYLLLERLARPATDFFITLSEKDRLEGLRLKILGRRARAIYTGINFSKLDRAADPAGTRARMGVPPGWQVLIMAGRLEPQKAPHLLINAFAQAVKTNPRTVLWIAGDGELRALLEEQIVRLGLEHHVHLLGLRDDVPDLLQAADVFVFSSLWEAMGRAMVEAMLLGKPVVVPAIYGIPEIVRHQETGLLYEVGQVDQLAAQLHHILQNPSEQQRLGQNARQLTRALFDVRVMVRNIEEVYQELLAAERSGVVPLPVPSVESPAPSTAAA